MTLRIRIVALLAMAGAGCEDAVIPPGPPIALTATDTVVVLEADSTLVTAIFTDASGATVPDLPVAWAAEDTTVVSVSSGGWVRFRAPGETRVIALGSGLEATVLVRASLQWADFWSGAEYRQAFRWCGVTLRGSLYCNPSGNFVTPPPTALLRVWTPPDVTIRQMALGAGFACLLADDGRAFCQGENSRAELGNPLDSSWGATADFSPVLGGLRFASLAAGHRHACGLTGDGSAYCWGSGWLGNDSLSFRQSAPQPVAGGGRFTQLVLGNDHICGLATDGAVWCWGRNQYGQLGRGAPDTAVAAQPEQVPGLADIRGLSGGSSHVCALGSDARSICWGLNGWGQVGVASPDLCPGYTGSVPSCVLSPTATGTFVRFVKLETGGVIENNMSGTTCGIDGDGVAWCWGRNSAGTLGDGTTVDRVTPGPVAGDLRFSDLSVGSFHVCGRTQAGLVYCWGVYFDSTTPMRLPFQEPYQP